MNKQITDEAIKAKALFVEINPAPVIRTDYSGIIVFANQNAKQVFGQDAPGKHIAEIFAGISNEKFCKLTSKSNYQFEEKINDLVFLFTIKKETGIKSFFIYGSDITELKQDEEKIKYQSDLIENVSDAVISTDRDFIIKSWNLGAEKIYNYSASDAIGKEYHQLTKLDYVNTSRNVAVSKLFKREKWGGEITQKCAKNTRLYILSSVTLIKNENTRENSIAIINHNITKRKEAEQEIIRALEKERELNELKSRFTSMVSHEFRTPLAGISTSAEMLAMYTESLNDNIRKKALKQIDKIEEDINRLRHLMDDILVLGKYDANKVNFKPIETDIDQYIKNIIEDSFSNLENDRKIIFKPGSDKKTVSIDQDLFRHVILNLLSNAVKYSSENVTISFNRDKNNFYLMVKDKGIGIPEEDQDKIFGSFYRAKNAENISGTGLGLLIANEFVKLHQGSIEINSVLNKGTTVKLVIPQLTESIRE